MRSIWKAAAQCNPRAPLTRDLTVDVAIVGGGITGLMCAHALAYDGLKVAVLEARRIGEGSTGNSTGNLYALVGERPRRIERSHAETVLNARAEAVDRIEALVRALDIDCGWVRCPWVVYTHSTQPTKALLQAEDLARAGRLHARPTSVPLPVSAGLAFAVENQAQFNPLRFVHGLAASLPCEIYEGTPVTALDDERCRVHTPAGIVDAKYVVLASHTPKGTLALHGEMEPYREYGVAARLAREALPPGIFWSLDEPYRSIRGYSYDNANHVVVVGESHWVGRIDDTRVCYAELEAFVRNHFGTDAIAYRWSAQNYRAADGLPYVGRLHPDSRVLVATGFGADGLTYGAVSAHMLSDVIAERPNPMLRLLDPSRLPHARALPGIMAEGVAVLKQFARDIPWIDRGDPTSLAPGEAKVFDRSGEKIAAFRNDRGELEMVSAVCTHMQCIVRWNTAERTWDCPCHGSRFEPGGRVIEGPAWHDLPARPATPE
ncbi:MAG TPA: FAD-dependent oxidoreductase [Casimicrobiaceae bacterium]|nr:FAD-dependent oxidoreductase [Casimicrobiaceae bacterium]